MDTKELGRFVAKTGNQCSMAMTVEKAARVEITFTWDREPTADDREAWDHEVLGTALCEALDYAAVGRLSIETLRGLESDGTLERIGTTPGGDWLFGATPRRSDTNNPSNVIPLQRPRKGHQRHTDAEPA